MIEVLRSRVRMKEQPYETPERSMESRKVEDRTKNRDIDEATEFERDIKQLSLELSRAKVKVVG